MNKFSFNTGTHYGDDFYNFVNKNWLDENDIPSDYQSWSTFQDLEKINMDRINCLMQNFSETNINYKKVIILYTQLNDSTLRSSQKNIDYINKLICIINRQTSIESLFSKILELDIRIGINMPINFVIQSSFQNANENILHFVPGGLGLPDRDYYFLESKEEIRNTYINFISAYMKKFNMEVDGRIIFDLEKQLAEKTMSMVEKRNTTLINNPTNFNDFISLHPNLCYLYNIFIESNKSPGLINIANVRFMIFFNDFINQIDINLWKQYFIFHLFLEFNYCLSEDIEELYFNFYLKTLNGVQIMKPCWMRAIINIDKIIGELIGMMYSDKYFNLKSKTHALRIVNLIMFELEDYLQNNDWMETQTKEKALEKLQKMRVKIGFPDIIHKPYDNLNISNSNTLVENICNAKKFNNRYILNTLYETIDRDRWMMGSHVVNAYYSPSLNEIVFPAGILQEPFFSIHQDDAYNFGGFGTVIGHEITHAFDDEGSKYDADGNLNNWWSESDLCAYKEKTQQIILQYSQYELEGKKINGHLTLGENIADIGGLLLSLKAFKKFINMRNKIYVNYDHNLSQEQKFFVNFANIWKSKNRIENIHERLLLDVHSPPIFRVNGTLKNIDEFYNVYTIKESDNLYLQPDKRVRIWN